MLRPRRSRLSAVAALMAVAALAVSTAVVFGATKQVDITEADGQFQFQPAITTVEVGDTVHWQNASAAPHTVSANDGAFNGDIAADTGSFDRTFDTAGTYAYHCEIHPSMTGTVTVNEASGGGGGPTQPPTDSVIGTSGDGTGDTPLAFLLLFAFAAAFGGLYTLRRLMAVSDTRD